MSLPLPFSLFPPFPCLRKYDSLIQDQARELSYLRQKIREGRGICYLLTQHAKDTVKSFEDLLRSNDIDYYLGQSFREQLAQGSQLTDRLASKLSTSKLATGLWDTQPPSASGPGGCHTSTAGSPCPPIQFPPHSLGPSQDQPMRVKMVGRRTHRVGEAR